MRKLGFGLVILAIGFSFWFRPATARNQAPPLPARLAGRPPLAPPAQQPPTGAPGNPLTFLSGPAAGDPLDIALNYLRNNAARLGLTPGDLAGVLVTNRYTSPHNGVTHIYLRQRLNGLEIYGANLNLNLSREGQVISLGNRFIPGAQAQASAAGPGLSPLAAVEAAARQLGLNPAGLALRQNLGGPAQAIVVSGGAVSQEDIPVRLVYQPSGKGGLRLAWEMVIHPPDNLHWWSLRVDGDSGLILSQVDWVAHDSYNVYPLPMESPDEGPRMVASNPAAANPVASPYGWHDTNGVTGPEFTVTRGNNVSAQADALDGLFAGNLNNANFATPEDGQAPRMQMYVWRNPAAKLQINSPAALAGDQSIGQADFGPAQATVTASIKLANDGVGTVTDGCEAFPTGFFGGFIALIDEGGSCDFVFKAKNAQNAGAVGALISTSNFFQFMPGSDPSITIPVASIFLFTADAIKGQLPGPGVNATIVLRPDRDSSLDNTVIIHEYGHGLSTRLTGGPANSGCLFTNEAGGMGEGWSDFLALVLTARPGDTGPQARGNATYASFEPSTGPGTRHYPYSTDLSLNPLTLSNMPDTGGRVHYIGEIWNSMLWEVYWNLVERYGFKVDFYNGQGGNNRALQLVVDGMKFQPCNPSLTEARDAILLADMVNNGGANQCSIWKGFAKRGLGPKANTRGPNNENDDTTDFELPGFCTLLSKSANPEIARAGGTLTYTLVARNLLSTTIIGVVLTDTLPLDASYIAGSANANPTATGNTLRWTIGTMVPNAVVTRTFRVRLNPGLNPPFIFLDKAESGGGRWVASHTLGSADWSLHKGQAYEGSTAWFAPDIDGVSDQRLTLANPLLLPAGQFLSFWHLYETDEYFDGGVVEISTNGGSSWEDLGPKMIKNGYNLTLETFIQNPLEGQAAFSGDSGGYIQTLVDLSSYSGKTVLLRFRLGSDGSFGANGWYLDNIRVGAPPAPDLVNKARLTGNGFSPVTATAISPVADDSFLNYLPSLVKN